MSSRGITIDIQNLAPEGVITPLTPAPAPGPKILFADDAVDLREAIKIFLLEEGYQCQAAGDGAEAIWLFGEFQPDLVILDLHMPVVSGSDACAIIRQRSDVPIIIFTATDNAADSNGLFDKGATGIVLKSSGMGNLIEQVAFHLAKKNEPVVNLDRNVIAMATA